MMFDLDEEYIFEHGEYILSTFDGRFLKSLFRLHENLYELTYDPTLDDVRDVTWVSPDDLDKYADGIKLPEL